eukprot:gene42007-55745_t
MFRGLIYGSYRKPRELVWVFGCAIFLCLMAEAFMGYLLPWGQMSYWGAQVIVNLFAAIPFVGPDLALLIRGDFVVGDATLNRFFSFHVIAVPLVLLGLVVVVSGLVLDKLLPSMVYERGTMQIAHMVHAVATVLMMAMFLGHIYMGTIGMQGAYKAMRTGYVDETWAKEHHELWLDDIQSGKIAAQRSIPPAAAQPLPVRQA